MKAWCTELEDGSVIAAHVAEQLDEQALEKKVIHVFVMIDSDDDTACELTMNIVKYAWIMVWFGTMVYHVGINTEFSTSTRIWTLVYCSAVVYKIFHTEDFFNAATELHSFFQRLVNWTREAFSSKGLVDNEREDDGNPAVASVNPNGAEVT